MSGMVSVVDGDAIGQPCSPPTESPCSYHRVITAGQQCQIRASALSHRERYVDFAAVKHDVFMTPANVVASHDKLDSPKSTDDKPHCPTNVALVGHVKAERAPPNVKEVAATHVDSYTDKRGPVPARRNVVCEELVRELFYFATKLQFAPELFCYWFNISALVEMSLQHQRLASTSVDERVEIVFNDVVLPLTEPVQRTPSVLMSTCSRSRSNTLSSLVRVDVVQMQGRRPVFVATYMMAL